MYRKAIFEAPTLRSWEDAARVESAIVPIRGRATPVKPLGKRRNTHVTIHKAEVSGGVSDGPAYICTLYNTEVLTYLKSGEVLIKMDGWTTNTTTALLSEVLFTDVRLTRGRVWMWCKADVGGEVVEGYYRLNPLETNVLTRVGDRWQLHNPDIPTLHTVNRAGANSVRSRYAQFLRYMVGMIKAHGDTFEPEELQFDEPAESMMLPTPVNIGHTTHTRNVPRFLELAKSDRLEDNYKALQMVQRTIAYRVVPGKYCVPGYFLKGVLDTALMNHYFNTWFTGHPAPPGKIVHDKYAKYLT